MSQGREIWHAQSNPKASPEFFLLTVLRPCPRHSHRGLEGSRGWGFSDLHLQNFGELSVLLGDSNEQRGPSSSGSDWWYCAIGTHVALCCLMW